MKTSLTLLFAILIITIESRAHDPSIGSVQNKGRPVEQRAEATNQLRSYQIDCFPIGPEKSASNIIADAKIGYPSNNKIRDGLFENIAFNILRDSDVSLPPIVYGKKHISPQQLERNRKKSDEARVAIREHKLTASALNDPNVINSFTDEFLYSMGSEILKDHEKYLLTTENYPNLKQSESSKNGGETYQPINDVLLLMRGLKHRDDSLKIADLTNSLIVNQTINEKMPYIGLQAISFAALESNDTHDIPVLWEWLNRAVKNSQNSRSQNATSKNHKLGDSSELASALQCYWSRIATRDCVESIVRVANDVDSLKKVAEWHEMVGRVQFAWINDDPVITNAMLVANKKMLLIQLSKLNQ